MVMFNKFWSFVEFRYRKQQKPLNPYFILYRFYRSDSKLDSNSSNLTPALAVTKSQDKVAIFWDLDNKPPKSFPPYDAAVKLRTSASSFGVVRHMVAYANQHAFSYVPQVVREQRKERNLLNQLENKSVIKPKEPYPCQVCGRKFYNNEKLINHFKQIHEREHQKRLNQIESARGKRRVKLVGRYAMKMEKYKYAARSVLTPKVGYGLADELKRAGFWVRAVSDKPQAADVALRNHMVDVMDKRRAECVMLVSDDSDFVDVLEEAKLRCLKTVVVGDVTNGALKRVADAAFSWQEIMMGKAKKEAVKVAGRWQDRNILKRLEWKYNPKEEGKFDDAIDVLDDSESEDKYVDDSEEEIFDGRFDGDAIGCMQNEDTGAWWELDSDPEAQDIHEGKVNVLQERDGENMQLS